MTEAFKYELQQQMEKLEPHQQQQVLHFAQSLVIKNRTGIAGKNLLRFAGSISQSDLKLIAQEIESGCEQVNPHVCR